MRSLRTALVVALALGVAGVALGHAPPSQPAPPGVSGEDTAPPAAKKGVLPPGLAKRFGAEVPEEAWIAFHPARDDGAWFLIDYEWTLVTGFSPSVKAEVKDARKLPARTPPIPPPKRRGPPPRRALRAALGLRLLPLALRAEDGVACQGFRVPR